MSMSELGGDNDTLELVEGRYGQIKFFKRDTVVGAALRKYGEWAQNELEFLNRFVATGGIVLDVGAYIGTHALAFSRMVGAGGEVICFEPQPRAFQVLELNLQINGVTNVRANNAAVGAQVGSIDISTLDPGLDDNFGGHALIRDHDEAQDSRTTSVKVLSIDSLGLRACDLIKIDVEGAESSVLEGANETIRQFRPVVYAECNSLEDGARTLSMLRALNYKVLLHLPLAFNAQNFKGSGENIFNDSREAALIGIGVDHELLLEGEGELLFAIEHADDLAYGMLQKPQYFSEVLRAGAAARCGGYVPSLADYESLSERVSDLQRDNSEFRETVALESAANAYEVQALKAREQLLVGELDEERLLLQKTEETFRVRIDWLEKRLEFAEKKRRRSAESRKSARNTLARIKSESRSSIEILRGELAAEQLRLKASEEKLTEVARKLRRVERSNFVRLLRRVIDWEMNLRDRLRDPKRRTKRMLQRSFGGTGERAQHAVATRDLAGHRSDGAGKMISIAQMVKDEALNTCSSDRPLLVCVSHIVPWPPMAGNEFRIHRLLEWITSVGWDVVLVVSPLPGEEISESARLQLASAYPSCIILERTGELRYRTSRRDVLEVLNHLNGKVVRDAAKILGETDTAREGRTLPIVRTFCPSILVETLIALDRVAQPRVFLLNYCFMTRALPALRDSAVKIVDTHDVFSTKEKKVKRFGVSDGLSISAEEEGRLLTGADFILAIQPEEAKELSDLGVSGTIVTVGVDMPFPPESCAVVHRPNILMVGSANEMNRKGLRDFLRFAWPLVLKSVPEAELHIVGSVGSSLVGTEPRVKWHGRVENLDEVYSKARVVINPAVAGTGLKIKTLEALSRLRPIVLWPLGLEGVEPELRGYCDCVTDWYEFATKVAEVLVNDGAAGRVFDARERVASLLSPSHVYEGLAEVLDGARLGKN